MPPARQPLELHKIGSMEEKRKRFENDSSKRIGDDELGKYLREELELHKSTKRSTPGPAFIAV